MVSPSMGVTSNLAVGDGMGEGGGVVVNCGYVGALGAKLWIGLGRFNVIAGRELAMCEMICDF